MTPNIAQHSDKESATRLLDNDDSHDPAIDGYTVDPDTSIQCRPAHIHYSGTRMLGCSHR